MHGIKAIAGASVAFLGMIQALGAEPPGLVAQWRFSEGSGTVLHDSSGHGNHGAIQGAQWVRNGTGWALDFDGIDDCVDCGAGPSLDLRDRASIVAWVWSDPRVPAGEPGIVGKAYSSYVITRYGGQAWAYISGGGHNAKADITPGRWHHIAATYDHEALRLFVDGRLADARPLDVAIAAGKHFWMARSDGVVKFTQNAHFRGKLTEVCVYSRALTPAEIEHLARTTNLSGRIAISPTPVPAQNRVLIDLDGRGLGPGSAGRPIALALFRADAAGHSTGPSLGAVSSVKLDGHAAAATEAPMQERPEGRYVLRATPAGGVPSAAVFTWTPFPAFPRGVKTGRQLNNLVTELLRVTAGSAPNQPRRFVNPHPGWVWISNRGTAEVTLEAQDRSEPIHVVLEEVNRPGREAMHWLSAGRYVLRTPKADRLIVRAVPEIIFARYDSQPHVTPCGPYGDAFHRRYVFPNINTFVGRADEPFAREWQRRGGHWLVRCSVPKGTHVAPLTVETAYRFLAGNAAFRLPQVDGLIADEFGNSTPECAVWAKAVGKILGEPAYRNKLYYPYANDLWTGPEGRELTTALIEHGSGIAWKRYLKEQRSEADAWRFLDARLVQSAQAYRRQSPGSIPRIIVCFGYFSAPPEQLDTFPNVDYKTFLDMQLNLVANHPAFNGIGGVMSYLASYADEETVRWMLKLFRHYAIDGATARFSHDPYILGHIENGDFEQQGAGWRLDPAESGSIRFAQSPGFGWLQGRYPRTREGDTVLVTRRSAQRPNVFGQQIDDLTPGRLYSVRLFAADFRDLSRRRKHAFTVTVEHASMLPDKSFTHVFANCYSHHYGPYDREHRAWMNYYWCVFRAQAATAMLRVSDWTKATTPGGPIGQELMFNFVQIQPYDPAGK